MAYQFKTAFEAIELDLPKPKKGTIRNRINKALHSLPTYHDAIPLDAIFEIIDRQGGIVVDEAGEPWSGLLLGDEGSTTMKIAKLGMWLYLSWYRMPSGRYEIVAYVS